MLAVVGYQSLPIYPVVTKIIYMLFQDKPLPRRPFLSSSSFSSADHNNSSITERFVLMWWLPFHLYYAPNFEKFERAYLSIPLSSRYLWALGIFSGFFVICWSADFFQNSHFEKIFQEYHQSVKQFRSRSGPTFWRAWSGSKLFTKVISRLH